MYLIKGTTCEHKPILNKKGKENVVEITETTLKHLNERVYKWFVESATDLAPKNASKAVKESIMFYIILTDKKTGKELKKFMYPRNLTTAAIVAQDLVKFLNK